MNSHQGSLLDFDTVYNFGKKVDFLTIEIENVNVDALRKIGKRRCKSVSFFKNN